MQRRKLGSTGLMVTPLCFGCAAAYARNLITDEHAIDLFKHAYDLGIRFFDTGHSYGKAEERIGQALKACPEISRQDVVISTKAGTRIIDGKYAHDVSEEWIKRSVEISLERMGIDYIDVLYIHGPSMDDIRNERLLRVLSDLRSQGVIRTTGANTFDTPVIEAITQDKTFDVIMLDYNIVRQDREPQIEMLHSAGIACVAGQALAESVFLNSVFKLRSKKDIWYLARTFGRKQSRDLFIRARKYRFLNQKEGPSGSQVALRYVLDNPYVSSASFGTVSFEHLEENCNALNLTIPVNVLTQLNGVDLC